jgi:hypothetical protein
MVLPDVDQLHLCQAAEREKLGPALLSERSDSAMAKTSSSTSGGVSQCYIFS